MNNSIRIEKNIIIVLANWSSGSTAIAGYIHKLGAFSCPPHQMTNDIRTPNSYEPLELSKKLRELINETGNLEPLVDNHQEKFKEWFAEWLENQYLEASNRGQQTIILKHPLMSFFIKEINEVCTPKYVIVTRSSTKIEATRQRRGWHRNYGVYGAQILYSRIFSSMMELGLSALMINFEDFRNNQQIRKDLKDICHIKPEKMQLSEAESWVK